MAKFTDEIRLKILSQVELFKKFAARGLQLTRLNSNLLLIKVNSVIHFRIKLA